MHIQSVTPYAGVWIEIFKIRDAHTPMMSLPTRECGLKFTVKQKEEIIHGHSLRGSVD